jgi:starch phosphorylase
MSQKTRVSSPVYNLLPTEIDGFDALAELALNIRWSWNHATDDVWRQLDNELWEITHNPWVVLQTAARDRIESVLADPAFRKNVDDLLQTKSHEVESPAWFQQNYPNRPLNCVAYFSMEFMISEALPIYSGGLGNVAGDQLKGASDLGVPVVGIGLLYQQGYFRQVIDKDGAQQALFPYNDPGQLPITPVRQANGEWLRVEIRLPGYSVWLRIWQVLVGKLKLYLLDTNDPANFPVHRGIAGELYGGGPELRLKQELLLGIGGWRLLEALGLEPEVCHLNEGHAAFAVLERARAFMEKTGQPFKIALAVTRAGNLFTTHSAVDAGFDRFPPNLIDQYLCRYAEQRLGITMDELLALGRHNPHDSSENFNMAYLAIRGSGAINGVSQLHEQVSRQFFAPLFPRWPLAEVPVGHVTNGVHMPTWDSASADELWTEACGKERWLGTAEATLEQDIRRVSDVRLWQFRTAASKSLVEYACKRFARQLASSGEPPEVVEHAKNLFDPNALTLGFARRFASYKRPNLLLQDPDRLIRILTNPYRPVQLIIAGKAHPADHAGQDLIRQWMQFIRRPEARAKVIFLSDYDMYLTERLVQGVDVWINTPRWPWEACGTSGMKVLVNGGLNLSVLDGWWAEAYRPELGWALGDGGLGRGGGPGGDATDAKLLYDLLEWEVIPEFYNRDENGIPTLWIKRMRESMAHLTPRFSVNRAVQEYTEKHYIPAAANYRLRAADNCAIGKQIVEWQHELDQKWAALHFGKIKIDTRGEFHLFEVQVYFHNLDYQAVRVELYADGIMNQASICRQMTQLRQMVGTSGGYVYGTAVPSDRPASDYTVRLIPYFDNMAIPLEETRIIWRR